MKKTLSTFALVILVASLFTISSCTKEALVVPYSIPEQQVCLNPDPYQQYQTYSFTLTQDDIKAAVEAAGGKWDLKKIKSAKIDGFEVEATGTGVNLNEVGSIEVYVKTTGTTGDGTQVAYTENIGTDATKTTLKINGDDLKAFLSESQLVLFVKILNKPAGSTKTTCSKLKSGVMKLEVSQD